MNKQAAVTGRIKRRKIKDAILLFLISIVLSFRMAARRVWRRMARPAFRSTIIPMGIRAGSR